MVVGSNDVQTDQTENAKALTVLRYYVLLVFTIMI